MRVFKLDSLWIHSLCFRPWEFQPGGSFAGHLSFCHMSGTGSGEEEAPISLVRSWSTSGNRTRSSVSGPGPIQIINHMATNLYKKQFCHISKNKAVL